MDGRRRQPTYWTAHAKICARQNIFRQSDNSYTGSALRAGEEFGWPKAPINLLDGAIRECRQHLLLWEYSHKITTSYKVPPASRKVAIWLPGKENSNSHGARPVHQIISMIKWIRTSRFSLKNSLSTTCFGVLRTASKPQTSYMVRATCIYTVWKKLWSHVCRGKNVERKQHSAENVELLGRCTGD